MTKQLDNIMTFILIVGFGLLISLVMTGCQTAKGFGKDVENTGESIQHEASK
jgi:predicted small secreted protein